MRPDEYFEVRVRYTHMGGEVILPVRVQRLYWYVDRSLYLQAYLETDRVYHWSVRVVQQTDADDQESYVPSSLDSEEWSFYWR